jgi:hypothetical protein
MSAERIHIGELRIRVPGLSQAAARALGERVAKDVAAGLAAGGELRQSLGGVRIQVAMPRETGTGQLSGEIARAILRSLR